MALQEREQELGRGDIRFPSDLLDDSSVIEICVTAIVEIIRIITYIKDPIPFDSIRLMNLKIETNRFHRTLLYHLRDKLADNSVHLAGCIGPRESFSFPRSIFGQCFSQSRIANDRENLVGHLIDIPKIHL